MLTGFILVFLFFAAVDLHAADITHHAQKTEFEVSDEVEFDVSLTISAQDSTEYFLRGVFFKPGDNNYCGYTWSGTSYFAGPYSTGDQWKNFLKVTITNNTWSGKLKAKIDPDDTGCRESGEYRFKIQRFTSSGAGNFDNQEESTLYFTIPTQTPTPQPTATPQPTPKPTKVPTRTPTPKVDTERSIKTTLTDEENAALTKNILSGKDINVKKKQKTPTKKPSIALARQAIKGVEAQDDVEIEKETKDKKKGRNIFVYFGGGSLLLCCGILLFQAYRKRQEER